MIHRICLIVVLFGVWLLWSGLFEPLLLSFGVLSCVIVLWILARMGVVDQEAAPIRIGLRFPFYAPWLLWQIVRSNVDVAARILKPALPIEPGLIRVKAGQRSDLGRVIYANSITLTPGTVSVAVDGDEIAVHALSHEAAADLLSGEMDRRVRRLEGKNP